MLPYAKMTGVLSALCEKNTEVVFRGKYQRFFAYAPIINTALMQNNSYAKAALEYVLRWECFLHDRSNSCTTQEVISPLCKKRLESCPHNPKNTPECFFCSELFWRITPAAALSRWRVCLPSFRVTFHFIRLHYLPFYLVKGVNFLRLALFNSATICNYTSI